MPTAWRPPAGPTSRHYCQRGNNHLTAVNFKTCMPVLIVLHINGDPAGVPTESATLNVTETKTIQADMVDELGR